MESIFTIDKEITFSDCNRDGELQLATFLMWASEIAGQSLDARGISRTEMLEEGQVFLLSKVAYRRLKAPLYGMRCTLNTWEHAIKGVQFIRNVSLDDQDGEPLCQYSASWFLADPISRKILRPRDYHHESLLCDRTVAAELHRLKFPELPEIARHTVRYSEIDGNGHMNNRFYANLLLDYAPEQFLGKRVRSADIAYIHEAFLGEEIRLHCAADGENGYMMYGDLPDGRRCFDAHAEVIL